MKPRAVLGLLLLAVLAGVLVLLQQLGPKPATGTGSGERLTGTAFAGPRTCLPCHAAVVAEG